MTTRSLSDHDPLDYQGENEGAGAYARPQDWQARPSIGPRLFLAGLVFLVGVAAGRLLLVWMFG